MVIYIIKVKDNDTDELFNLSGEFDPDSVLAFTKVGEALKACKYFNETEVSSKVSYHVERIVLDIDNE